MNKLAVLLALLALPTPALADTASLFRDGKFVEASQAGLREGTPEALVLAARSVLAVAAYRTPDKARALQLSNQAAALADAALARRPGDPAALLQKGIAIGYVAKLERSPGRAKAARKLMDQARSLAPGDPLAWAALGGWHGESVATLGGFLAGTALGAKKSESIKAFEAALAKGADGAVVPTFYAFTLLALDPDNAPRARTLLAQAVRASPRDGFEALLWRQAEQVLPLLQKNDVAGARALAKRLQPFGTLS
jgi:tetratricopeptide (TPR) repeat protein